MPAPRLANVAQVELMHAGTWRLSTGWAQFSRDDLMSAVAAQSCPAVRRPVLKLGHTDPRFDGQPAIGWIGNMDTAMDGHVLVGDYCGLPSWMTEVDASGNSVVASAFPDRSMEGQWGFRCQLSHLHPFVITAVALLGEVPPGIGTLESLQDVAALYGGVAASSSPAGTPVTVTIRAAKEAAVPDPQPPKVNAAVSVDDVRKAFNEKASWDQWITEILLDPLQVIVMDDCDGCLCRIPVTANEDGTVTFGDPVKVRVEYVDAPSAEGVAMAAAGRLVYASRGESRPGAKPATPPAAPVPTPVTASEPATPDLPAAEPEPTTEPKEAPTVSTELSGIRSRLGLPDDADETAILAALDEKLVKPPAVQPTEPEGDDGDASDAEPAKEPELVTAGAAKLPPGVVVIDATRLEALERDAKAGAAAQKRLVVEDRDRLIGDAVKAGKFAPARSAHWAALWDKDPDGTKSTIEALAAGLVPVGPSKGYAGGEENADAEGDADDDRLFAPGTFAKTSKEN